MFKFFLILISFLLFTSQSYAYLGPGIAGGVLLATVGIVIAILASIFGFFWFGIKKILKKKEKPKQETEDIDK